jgi:Gluconate 2-dehydrogenase subunit 3
MSRDEPVNGAAGPVGSRTSRRHVLRTALGGVLLGTGLFILRRVFLPSALGTSGREAFTAMLDALLPDGDLPGWRRTTVMPRLVDDLSARRQTRRALVEGVEWLDRRARRRYGRPFASLLEPERDRVVRDAADQAEGTLPRFFYRVVRDRAMRLHYAHPAAWRPLGLPHPPQPDGYPDFTEPPRG